MPDPRMPTPEGDPFGRPCPSDALLSHALLDNALCSSLSGVILLGVPELVELDDPGNQARSPVGTAAA